MFPEGKGYCHSCGRSKPWEEGAGGTQVGGNGHSPAPPAGALPESPGVPIIEDKPLPIMKPAEKFTWQTLGWRGVAPETMAVYGVRARVLPDGTPDAFEFPYGSTASKFRSVASKKFWSTGQMSEAGLFGADKFSAGAGLAITITEGELDALSAYQMLGGKYPVVSVRSASSAREDCVRYRDWINSHEKIYLAFDADEVGQKAARDVAPLFDFNKVYHVKLTKHKDANAYLTAGDGNDFKWIWYNAKKFLPEGIISSQEEFDKIIDESDVKQGIPYPFKVLTEKTYGLRTGEAVLFTALEGIGKTEIVRAIEAHLLRVTEDNVGIIHLEESKSRTLLGLAQYHLSRPVHLPNSGVSKDEVKDAIKAITRRDERVFLYSHFGSSDPDVILDTIRFLVTACGCKWVFLDHITMVVSGLSEDDERKTLDYISTRLAMMVEELDFGLIFVSHVNDHLKTRGSRNISKIADIWVHLHRDQEAASEEERNTTYLTIRKNRWASHTGPGGKLFFDVNTFVVTEKDDRDIRMPPA